MYKHLVLWKTRTDASADGIKAMWEGLEQLRRLPMVKNWSYGSNIHPKIRDFDAALSVDFDSEEELSAYKDHPLHVRIANEQLFPLWESFTVVDYEY